MVRYISICLLVLGLTACTNEPEQQVENIKQEPVTQNKQNETNGQNKDTLPALHIQPAVYDLGDIKEGEAAIATFFIRNNSKQSIELVDIQASCGCTAAEPDSFIIAPNSFTQLKVAVDTTAKQDDIKKAIYITDSLGHKATAMLTFNVIDNPHFSMKKGGVKSIFEGKCASCHYQPLVGVNAPNKLYEVGCAMCHGENAEGAYAPSLRGHSLTSLQQTIAHGVGTRQMPGFAENNGGPLTDTQIKNLATWLTSLPQSTK